MLFSHISDTHLGLQQYGLDEGEQKRFRDETKQAVQPDTRYSVSAVVACYKDGEAIPILYERLSETFRKLSLDYEIIFVNDGSSDNSLDILEEYQKKYNDKIIVINFTKNFGLENINGSSISPSFVPVLKILAAI